MTLRGQINLIVGALTVLFVAAVITLQLRSLREAVHEEVIAANRVAAQLLNRTTWRYAAQGAPAMLGFLQGVGRVRSTDITLLDAQGQELYRSPPSPYKAGRDAPPWFAALMSPPAAVQAIDFPDGKLVMRSNASRAVLDAWDEVAVLAGGALLLLLAVNLLVYALVGRAVRPFGQIEGALNRLQAGSFNEALPPLPGREAAAIGAAFNRMLGELQGHIDTERRAVRAENQLSDSRELARWVDRQIEKERHLIASELHDELGQSVTAMRSMALSIAQRVGGVDAQAAQAARVIADESSRLYDAMHGIIPRLTPLVLDSFGLADALSDLVDRTRRSQPGLTIATHIALGLAPLAPDVALALYRAAQEGITNALRHGQAQHLWLDVTSTELTVDLSLRDDGCGLPAPGTQSLTPSEHYGLRWLSERVLGLNGEVHLGPAEPRGALLKVRVPLPPTAATSLAQAP